MPEGVNLSHKLLRIKARPKILLCDNYEEAWNYFWTYRRQRARRRLRRRVPQRRGKKCPDAGVQFAEQGQGADARRPVVLQSGKPENEEAGARRLVATFLLKGSPTLLRELRHFMLENFGFGDFVFRTAERRRSRAGRTISSRSSAP